MPSLLSYYLKFYSSVFLTLATITASIRLDCNGNSMRCLLSCEGSSGGRVRGRHCPLGWVCCQGTTKANPYLPLRLGEPIRQPRRQKKHYSISTSSVSPHSKLDPSTLSYHNELHQHTPDNKKQKIFPGHKSGKYCKEWTKLTIEYLHAMPILPEVIPFRIKMNNCAPRFTPLIVGGRNATEGEFPHMAALGYFRNDGIDYLCGGTLISDNYVLTAAHCTRTRWGPPIMVQLGSKDLYSIQGIEVAIVDIAVHPEYSPPSCYHDIALLKLENPIKFSPSLRPACLPTQEMKPQTPGSIAIATGWGKVGLGRESSPNLKKVALKVLDSKNCEKYYASDVKTPSLNNGITSDLLCASGYLESHHDTCQGDSGGPLQTLVSGNDCTFQVVGITSFGKACGSAMPAVYTRVAPYVPWIENIVWP